MLNVSNYQSLSAQLVTAQKVVEQTADQHAEANTNVILANARATEAARLHTDAVNELQALAADVVAELAPIKKIAKAKPGLLARILRRTK
ncbi:MAG TPA: hypothetical protein VF595_16055 [Tepidisphaeraceae bacterium]|jgi:hypothetical protein